MQRTMTMAVCAAMLCLAAIAAGQDDSTGGLVITSPAQGSYVTGPVLLQVKATAAEAIRQVTFFADGRSVCTVVRPPFECSWDAGPGLREHVVRAVATRADGSRAIAFSSRLVTSLRAA